MNTTPGDLKSRLHEALASLGPIDRCVLLDYPDYANIGDHLIWLGSMLYLTQVLNCSIAYAASLKQFSPAPLAALPDRTPILMQGGGNFGDLWPQYQDFREKIVTQYPDRPIIFLPQSLYFQHPENLARAAQIFNAHPNITLFVRDTYSYQLATEHFSRCRIIQSPDMAFHLIGMPGLPTRRASRSVLYHCRIDVELNPDFAADRLGIPNLTVEDWRSYQWLTRETVNHPNAWYWRIPGSVRLLREGWQRGVRHPLEWASRRQWLTTHPYTPTLRSLYNPPLHLRSWELMHSAVYQFSPHRAIITNRLHGHILCLILQIPHVFLPNSYYKNEAFYNTWTSDIPFAKFVKDKSQIQAILQSLLS